MMLRLFLRPKCCWVPFYRHYGTQGPFRTAQQPHSLFNSGSGSGFSSFGSQAQHIGRRHVHRQPRQLRQPRQPRQHWQTGQPPPPIPSGPSAARRICIWSFIGGNVIVFLWWNQAGFETRKKAKENGVRRVSDDPATWSASGYVKLKHMYDNYTLSLRNLQEGRWHTLFTSVVSHMELSHLIFNMFSFYAFTEFALSARLPVPTLLALGIGSAIASDLATLYDWARKDKTGTSGLGASGVISGMGAALACTYPMVPFQIFLIPIDIPLWALVAGYVAYDSYRLNSEESNIGHAAHLGGFAFGTLFYAVFLRKYGGIASLWRAYRGNIFGR